MRKEQRDEWPFHHASLAALFHEAKKNPAYQTFNKTSNAIELLVGKLRRHGLEGSDLDVLILDALVAIEEQGFVYGFVNASAIWSEVMAGSGHEDNPWVNWDPDPGDGPHYIWQDIRRNQADMHTGEFTDLSGKRHLPEDDDPEGDDDESDPL